MKKYSKDILLTKKLNDYFKRLRRKDRINKKLACISMIFFENHVEDRRIIFDRFIKFAKNNM